MSKDNDPVLFKGILFPAPYVMFEKAKGLGVQNHLLDQGVIPIIQINDREHQVFIDLDASPKPPNVGKLKSVLGCIKYIMNFEC